MSRSSLKDSRIVKCYSEVFKQKVLQEITDGKYSKREASRVYGMSNGSVNNWIKKSNRLDLLNKRVRIEMANEKDQLKELKSKLKEMESAMVQMQLKHLKSEADLAVAVEELGYKDKEDFLKKRKANRSKRQS